MTDLIKWLVPLVSIILMCIPYSIIKGIKMKKEEDRWKQLRFVSSALLYAIMTCFLFDLLKKLLDMLFTWDKVQSILNLIAPPNKIDYAITLFATILINSAILIIFCIVKGFDKIGMKNVCIPTNWEEFKDKKTPRAIYWAMLNAIYSLYEKNYCLRVPFVKVRNTLKYFVRIMGVLYLLALFILELPLLYSADWIPFDLMEKILSTTYLWPSISLIILCECLYYLCGKENLFEEGKIVKEKAAQLIIADYSELEKEYKRVFEGRYIRTLNIKDHSRPTGQGEEKAYNPVMEGIVKKLQENKFEINPTFINHIENISEGKDVIIDSSAYSEFGEYLYRYLNMVLARGETVLFICPDEHQMEQLCEYTEERLKIINSYHQVWKTKKLLVGNLGFEEIDILFVTPQFVKYDSVFSASFFENLSTVIIANATETMARDNLQLSLLSFKLTNVLKVRKSTTQTIQYICLSESIPLGIRKTLVETLQLPNHLEVRNAYSVHDSTKIMLWRYEDENARIAQDKLFDGQVPRYWGVALPLASIALKFGVDMVSLFSHIEAPHVQMLENMNAIHHILDKYFGSVQVDFEKQIAFNRYNRENKYARFFVVDDELCNLPMVIYNSARFGGTKTTMIHIVSKQYMLRDFFFANAETYIGSESHINMFMPSVADTLRLSVFRLLYELQKTGLPEETVIERVQALVIPQNAAELSSIQAALTFCLEKATGRSLSDSVYNHFFFYRKYAFDPVLGAFEVYYLVKYQDRNAIDNMMAVNALATLRIHDQNHQANFFADGIYQRYLPGQYLIYNSFVYRVHSIDNRTGTITLLPGPDDCRVPSDYSQIRTYAVDNSNPQKLKTQTRKIGVGILESYTLQHYRMPVSVETHGYYTHEMTGDQFNFKTPPPVDGTDDTDMLRAAERSYTDASVLSLKINGRFGTSTDKVTFLLAVVMNEFFKTWFPYSHDCIAVCPVLYNPEAIYGDEIGKYISELYPKMTLSKKNDDAATSIEVYIIEDSSTDLGIVQSLIDNWQDMFGRIFENLREYLNWQQRYDDKGDDNISNKYLYFGKKDGEPDCFDFKTLTNLLNEISKEYRVDTADTDEALVSVKGTCGFCGDPIQAVQFTALDDGRMMCGRCASLIVTDEEKLKELFAQAVSYLNAEWGVTIANDINIRFATAESIRLRMHTGDERVILGFADPDNRELWVESDAPAINLSDVLIHELTHFWQFDNISCEDMDYIEGHSSYLEVQYLHHLGEDTWANYIEDRLEKREDIYGRGFRRLKQELADRGDPNSFTYMKQLFGSKE